MCRFGVVVALLPLLLGSWAAPGQIVPPLPAPAVSPPPPNPSPPNPLSPNPLSPNPLPTPSPTASPPRLDPASASPAPAAPAASTGPAAPAASIHPAAPRAAAPERVATVDPSALAEMHRQAFELLRQEQFPRAAELFDEIYKAIPPSQRTRALILNRAVLDIAQRKFAMRAVRDVADYLKKNRAEDEPATNILAVALNIAAEDERSKKAPVWQSAFKEWDRRNYLLDHSREGWRRWGTRWLTEEEKQVIETRKEDLRKAIDTQIDRVNRSVLSVRSLAQQQQNAFTNQATYGYLRQHLDYIQNNPSANLNQRRSAQRTGTTMRQEEVNAWAAAQELGGELRVAMQELGVEQTELRRLQRELERIRPEWPTQMPPIDPDAPPPPQKKTLAPSATAPAPAGAGAGAGAAGFPKSPAPSTAPAVPVGPQDLYRTPATGAPR